MTTRAQATGAPVTLKFMGRDVRMRPLTDADFGEFEKWMQQNYIEKAKSAAATIEDDEDRRAVLKDSVDKMTRLSIASPDATEIMATYEGAKKLLYFSIRIDQPDITEKQIGEWLTNPENLGDAMELIDLANNLQPFVKKKSKKVKKRMKRPKPASKR